MTKIHTYIIRGEPGSEYESNGPLIPIDDKCCQDVCTTLHDTISDLRKEYKGTESLIEELARAPRGTEERQKQIIDGLQILQDTSYTLTEEGICKCVEKYPSKYPEGLKVWQE